MATVLSATGAITSLESTLPSASAGALPGYTTRTATATLLSGTYYITTTYTYLTQTTPTPTTPVSMTATSAATSTRRITSGSITRTGTSLRTSTTSRATIAASSGGGNRLPAGAITAIVIVSTLVVICLLSAWAYWYRRRNIRRRIAEQRVEVDGEEAVRSPTSGGAWTTPWNRARSPPPPSYTQVRTELDMEKLTGTSPVGMADGSGSAARGNSTEGARIGAGEGLERAPVLGYILEDDSSPRARPSPTPNPERAQLSASTPSPRPALASVLRPNLPEPRRGDDSHGESRVVVVEDGPAQAIRESLATGRIERADETSETVLFPPTYGSLYPRGR
ncbi:hypothetical protein JCM24511_00979 [Saitozyma sp. JCM 24511]|nr:hypothetical protein JCM24511_00979 [Saitozyma sp. JCM 24511]